MAADRAIDPLALARRIFAGRLERDRMFPEADFDQPAWSMMLDLFIAHHEGRLVNMFAASVASGVPQSTAHRWLEKMEESGLIARHPSARNDRDVMVELTPGALARMEQLLAGFGARLLADLVADDEAESAGDVPGRRRA